MKSSNKILKEVLLLCVLVGAIFLVVYTTKSSSDESVSQAVFSAPSQLGVSSDKSQFSGNERSATGSYAEGSVYTTLADDFKNGSFELSHEFVADDGSTYTFIDDEDILGADINEVLEISLELPKNVRNNTIKIDSTGNFFLQERISNSIGRKFTGRDDDSFKMIFFLIHMHDPVDVPAKGQKANVLDGAKLAFDPQIPVPSHTSDEVYQDIFMNGNIVPYFKEQSYGKANITGLVTDWIYIPDSEDKSCRDFYAAERILHKNIFFEDNPISEYVQENDIDLSDYDSVSFLINCKSGSLWPDGYAGSIKIPTAAGTKTRPYNVANLFGEFLERPANDDIEIYSEKQWKRYEYIVSHELGHNMGVHHSSGLNCGPNILSNTGCTHVEYGNLFDAMGYAHLGTHFNGFQKSRLGWLDTSNIAWLSSEGNQSAIIDPLNITPNGTKPQVVFVAPSGFDIPLYAVDFRIPGGYEDALTHPDLLQNAIKPMVYELYEYTKYHLTLVSTTTGKESQGRLFQSNHLLDGHPVYGVPWAEDLLEQATLDFGEEFFDPETGVTITASMGPGSGSAPTLQVDVNFDDENVYCTPTALEEEFLWAKAYNFPNDYVTVEAKLKNGDSLGCGLTEYTLRASSDALKGTLEVTNRSFPGQTNLILERVELSESIGPGLYPVDITILNNAQGEELTVTKTLVISP